MDTILVVNPGSSSVTFLVFAADKKSGSNRLIKGQVNQSLIISHGVRSCSVSTKRLQGTSNNSDLTQFDREKLSLINGRH
jgi:acetate kinase